MKRYKILIMLLVLSIFLVACNSSNSLEDKSSSGYVPDASQSNTEKDIQQPDDGTNRVLRDGFDEATNSEFTFSGIKFYIPQYYFVNPSVSKGAFASFYAETTDDTLAQLSFESEDISGVENVTVDLFYQVSVSQSQRQLDEFHGEEFIETSEILVAGFPGKMISFAGVLSDTDDETISYPSHFKFFFIYI